VVLLVKATLLRKRGETIAEFVLVAPPSVVLRRNEPVPLVYAATYPTVAVGKLMEPRSAVVPEVVDSHSYTFAGRPVGPLFEQARARSMKPRVTIVFVEVINVGLQ
jgi:hypothetical protein